MNKKEQKLNKKEFSGFFFIRDFVLYKGKPPSLRAIAERLGFKSPRSASLLINRLEEKGYVQRTPGGNLRLLKNVNGKTQTDRTVEIPLVGAAPCGLPFFAEENTEGFISVSQRLAKPGAQYFLLRAAGDSMDKRGIKDGDLVLVRQQPIANNGDIVIALIGDEATIKEFQHKQDKIILMPRSNDLRHRPIILDEDFMIQGIVVTTIPRID